MSDCPFCAILNGTAPVGLIEQWPNVWAITPLNPCVPGHILFIPTVHVADFTEDPAISSSVMFRAAQYAAELGGDCNLITSKGAAATQSVLHLHVHLLPRRPGDDVTLPWPHSAAVPQPESGSSAAGSAPPG
jgi:histidine triad (HIT) family protein